MACFDDFLGLVGACADPDAVITSAATTVPHLVCFSAQVTQWNFGEVGNSRGRFLDMVETSNCRVVGSNHSAVEEWQSELRILG